ncbi:hypothetical protein E1B28_009514 [Marasmius oreades]|uniref:Uncharacterized protein n=1 Tax=Marasmius oreades TaxID=181124 RepID=A0A9P7UQT6_9AGAR|nr:uncharacterized protein E1B28_009514 [Marasmius oreades]KAG7090395.1 hypothetical protein E1B28_009514 [Marasmius oreades]
MLNPDFGEWTGGLIDFLWFPRRANFCIFVLSSFLADIVLILRCYFIWNQSLIVAIIPAIICIGCSVGGFITAGTADKLILSDNHSWLTLHAQGGNALFAAWVTAELAINVILTCMIAGKILIIHRQVRKILGNNVQSMHQSIGIIVIESGMMYPIALILMLSLPSTPKEYVSYSVIHIVGIAPTLIVVRVGLGIIVQDVQSGLKTMQAVEPSGNNLDSQ